MRDSGLTAVINHGNLVLLGLQNWGDVGRGDAAAAIAADARAAIEGARASPSRCRGYRDEGHLELIPMARGDEVRT